MELLIVGSIALDCVETPFGKEEEVLGGSAVYSSLSALYFCKTGIVAVIGEDFPKTYLDLLVERSIDLRGVKQEKGKTFRWKGRYGFDLNEAQTLDTQLNVFSDFDPQLPEGYEEAEVIFLANIDPDLQLKVLDQVKNPRLIACDTMNYWIERKQKELLETLKRVDILIINESEARELSREPSLLRAARKILSFGPKTLIVKQGSYGAFMFNGSSFFSAPAYPLENVFDPTGAGDSFAGGFLGYLANTKNLEEWSIRQAIIFGSVMASYTVEDFSIKRLNSLSYDDIEDRFREFKRLSFFEDI